MVACLSHKSTINTTRYEFFHVRKKSRVGCTDRCCNCLGGRKHCSKSGTDRTWMVRMLRMAASTEETVPWPIVSRGKVSRHDNMKAPSVARKKSARNAARQHWTCCILCSPHVATVLTVHVIHTCVAAMSREYCFGFWRIIYAGVSTRGT